MPHSAVMPATGFRTFSLRRCASAFGLCLALALPATAQDAPEIIRTYGYSFYGDLSYAPDFEHLRYVNPDAPKGGMIAISAQGTLDSMNPIPRRGRAGVMSASIYESLLET
ncbi:MAG: ABC transporter substrate-binding protein, partial [Roseinatronobacter sp.]|nr:ABC transporter substrate-binding protein [Roseinatronobacter sp.]